MDAVITFSTFWAYLFVFILLEQGASRGQLEMLGAALFYSLTALAAVMLQGFKTIFSRPNWWRANWAMSHKLSLNQVLWAGLALSVALAAIGDINTSRSFLLSWLGLLYVCLLLANRYLPRKIIEAVSDGRAEKAMLFGRVEGNELLARWRDYRENGGTEVFEYVPDYTIQEVANLERLLQERNVTEVVFAELPTQTYFQSVLEICDRAGAHCMVLSDHKEIFRHKVVVSTEAGVQFIGLRNEPLEAPHNRFLKRVSDLILASAFLVAVSPLLCCVAIAQKLISRGPVFFREPRVGLKGESFRILKFRTKHVDESGSGFALGRFLCRYSMDEWAQIFNVFKGEMSIVGPRPHWPEQNEAFARAMKENHIRSEVKPGITGLAQVRGFRGKPASDEAIVRRVLADLEYVENWSLGLDVIILLRTILQRRRK